MKLDLFNINTIKMGDGDNDVNADNDDDGTVEICVRHVLRMSGLSLTSLKLIMAA